MPSPTSVTSGGFGVLDGDISSSSGCSDTVDPVFSAIIAMWSEHVQQPEAKMGLCHKQSRQRCDARLRAEKLREPLSGRENSKHKF